MIKWQESKEIFYFFFVGALILSFIAFLLKDKFIVHGKNILKLLSIAAIIFFCFFGISKVLNGDEINSVYMAKGSFISIVKSVANDAHPPFYYLILSLWTKIFGISDLAIRGLSVIFYIISLVLIFFLGKILYGDKETGLICAFLYMISPLSIMHAQIARQYSLLALLSIASTIFFVKLFFIKNGSKKDVSLYVIINILGTFTHYWFFFIIFSQLISYILLLDKMYFKRFFIALFISITPFVLLWTTVVLSQSVLGANSWMSKPGIYSLVETFNRFYGDKQALFIYCIILFIILFEINGRRIKLRGITDIKAFLTQRQTVMLLIFIAVSLLFPWFISQINPVYAYKYTIIALFPFAIFLGAALNRFGNRHIILILCYILIAKTSYDFFTANLVHYSYDYKTRIGPVLLEAGDEDIFVFTSLSMPTIDYYCRLIVPKKRFVFMSYPFELSKHPNWRDVNGMLKSKNILKADASDIEKKIDILINKKDRKVWLFYGSDVKVNAYLKKVLNEHFCLKEIKNVGGPFFSNILVYIKKDNSLKGI